MWPPGHYEEQPHSTPKIHPWRQEISMQGMWLSGNYEEQYYRTSKMCIFYLVFFYFGLTWFICAALWCRKSASWVPCKCSESFFVGGGDCLWVIYHLHCHSNLTSVVLGWVGPWQQNISVWYLYIFFVIFIILWELTFYLVLAAPIIVEFLVKIYLKIILQENMNSNKLYNTQDVTNPYLLLPWPRVEKFSYFSIYSAS